MILKFSQTEQDFIDREFEPLKGQMLHKAIDMDKFNTMIIAKALAGLGLYYHQEAMENLENAWGVLEKTEEQIQSEKRGQIQSALFEYDRSLKVYSFANVTLAYNLAIIHQMQINNTDIGKCELIENTVMFEKDTHLNEIIAFINISIKEQLDLFISKKDFTQLVELGYG